MRNGEIGAVHTKQLRDPIRELIAGDHRFTYFQLDHMLYFVRGFRKKSRKTPPKEIDYAMSIYKSIKSKL
ncbi:type II toxin-antitoxin system RelE/ParE family toxin [Candidatus Kaiserbacteria bacterium]|nr:type II toxin-antitoxin system RelE/ParE family toxin [Candidatus Kaiserbacteria bacterium]